MQNPQLKLFHNPQSRSAGVRILLEELGLAAEFELVDFKAPEKSPALLAANPLGKVPTLVADGAVVDCAARNKPHEIHGVFNLVFDASRTANATNHGEEQDFAQDARMNGWLADPAMVCLFPL